MFSFHKPKVYRSSTGCCICKAKSSSSRFTDSKKYEEDFIECFQLEETRKGEICNACVLLVKRWKKLPAGSNRNWRHVVDARAGPGIKSLTKFKSRNKKKPKDVFEKLEKIVKKKHVYLKPEREQSPAMSDEMIEEEIGSKGSSRSVTPEDCEDVVVPAKRFIASEEPPAKKFKASEEHPAKRFKASEHRGVKEDLSVNDFIDLTYFKRTKICCGVIFKGPYGEVIVDPTLIKLCHGCILRQERQRQTNLNATATSPFHSASASPAHSLASSSPAHSLDSTSDPTKQTGKTFSDSSSDSGYDESSNQGIGESKIIKNSCIITATTTTTTTSSSTLKIHPIKTIQLKTTVINSET